MSSVSSNPEKNSVVLFFSLSMGIDCQEREVMNSQNQHARFPINWTLRLNQLFCLSFVSKISTSPQVDRRIRAHTSPTCVILLSNICFHFTRLLTGECWMLLLLNEMLAYYWFWVNIYLACVWIVKKATARLFKRTVSNHWLMTNRWRGESQI